MTARVISPTSSLTLSLPSPGQRPPLTALTLLALLVLGVHAWLLTSSPSHISPAGRPATSPPFTSAMETRRIEPPPPAAPAAAPEPMTAVPVTPTVRKPNSKPKRPPAQVERAQEAPELIAEPAPEEVSSAPDAQPAANASEAGKDEPAAAMAAASAANNPASPAELVAPAVPALPQTTAVTAMALPRSAELKYKATGLSKGLTYHANTELAWYHDGTSYNTRMTLSAFLVGSFVWSSAGQVTPEGLAPTRFAEKRRGEVAAHFEPDKGQITFSANTPSAPWIKGAQDRATVFIQLAGMLAGDPSAFPPGSSISLYTVGPRSADVWTFVVEPVEVVSLPAGDMPALKLTRRPRSEYDNKVELWLAPSLGYLPVRSKVTQADGAFVDQQLSEAKTF
jgi:Protein of unknown function (DUF3108)